MDIKYLKLVNYKRTPLLGKKVLELNFNSKLVMLEGTNGSGKSSVFNQLSPLPADKNDFEEGGMEEIHIDHNKSEFILISDFSNKTPKYSFVMDGEELNPAGLVSTQRDLAYKYFGITPDIHDIAIGKEVFTNMTIPTRKKLLKELTKFNMDHVLRGYNKVKEQRNLFKLMLKSEQGQCKNEESKLIDGKEREQTEKELVDINKGIDDLLEMRGNLARFFNPESSESSMNDLRVLLDNRNKLIRENYTLVTSYPKDVLGTHIDKLTSEKARYETILENTYNELERLVELKKSLDINIDMDGIDLDEVYKSLKSEIEQLEGSLHYLDSDPEMIPIYEDAYFKNYSNILDALNDLPINKKPDGSFSYSSEEAARCNQETRLLVDEKIKLTGLRDTLVNRAKGLMELDDDVECPTCDSVWKLKDVLVVKDRKEELENIGLRLGEINTTIERNNRYVDEFNEYLRNYTRLMSSRSATLTVFRSLWEYVDSHELAMTTPEAITTEINKLSVEINTLAEIRTKRAELKHVEEQITLIRSLRDTSLTNVNNDIETQEERSIMVRDELDQITVTLSQLKYLETVYRTIDGIDNSIDLTKDNVREFNLSTVTSSIFNVIDDQIRSMRIRKVEIENLIYEQRNIEYAVKAHKVKISEIEEELKVTEAILEELSPKDGIIAKTISAFLNTIIDNVNRTLEKIWSYKMVLKPIDVANDSLNYRFKLEVEDKLSVSDISLASTGMKEAINLSFKLVIYKLLGFESYGLFLDELASNMDKVHTENMSRLIHAFATEGSFSRIFMISHKENMSFLNDMEVFRLS